jgi:hypothetical protein
MTEIDNCWCQKSQLTDIPCDHLLVICSFRKLDYTQYVSPFYTINYYINTWSGHWRSYGNKQDCQCTTVQSLGQIQQKLINEGEGRYAFQWLWMKWRIVSTGCQLEVELVPAWFRLSVCLCFLLLYLPEQLDFNFCCNISICLILFLNNVLIVLIFGFIKLYFNFCYNILDQSTDCCILFLI